MLSDAGGGLARRRREICCISRSFCNLSRSFFQFLTLYSSSLLSLSFHDGSMHCDNNNKGSPVNLLSLVRTVYWPATLVKEEYHLSTRPPTAKSEICLLNISRSMDSRTFAILVVQCLSRIPSKSNLSSPCSSTEWSSALTPDSVMILTAEGLDLHQPSSPQIASYPYVCGCTFRVIVSSSAKNLGFCLVGLSHYCGPFFLTRPTSQILNLSINYKRPSSKNCGPTRKAFQLKSRINIKAHLPITPNRIKANPRKSDPIPNAYRCVSLYQRSNLIFLIVQHPVSDGRRLQPCRVATWYTSFVLIGPSEELSLSKNFGNSPSPIRFNPSRTFSEWYRQLSNWSTKASPEESNHRISLTAGLYLGPLLASFPVRVSRMHGNSFFWMEISFIENFYRSWSSIFLPSLFSLMLCSYGSIERRLSSYLETTSMIWLCEYPFQILLQNSSIRSNLLVAAGLASARHEAKNPFLTPQNLLIMAFYEIPESFVEVS